MYSCHNKNSPGSTQSKMQ